ncbi:AbiH family protein [uncultured Lacinutrix sp.]|uniref:AbiH family protein n=1 Tax=uncultured Lacinutrix sp. TaxID=574032 RepID=UPI00262956B1|nr:AbiH family protein [uncultured Lacinutrix sp.]
MSKILITGNGFDLNIGLPTAYIDFIKILEYIQKNDTITFNSIFSLSNNHSLIKEKFNSFELNNEMINELKKDLSINEWFKFFENELKIETWIDFENKIEYVLNNIYSSVDYLKDDLFSKGSLRLTNIYYPKTLFNSNFEIIEVLKVFNVIQYDPKVLQSIRLNPDYLIKKYDYFIDVDLDKISKHLHTQLNHFKKIFNSYFEIFVFPFYNNYKNTEPNLYRNIDEHYTFNYTPTFERFYNSNITKYLHGKAGSSEDKIVLGINDIPMKNEHYKKYFIPFTKYFQKLNNNSEYTFIKCLKENYSNDRDMFFFIGHSLDESDKNYINSIFDYITDSKGKLKKIIIVYHNKKAKSKLILNLLNIRGTKNIQLLTEEENLIFIPIDSPKLKQYLDQDISPMLDSFGIR